MNYSTMDNSDWKYPSAPANQMGELVVSENPKHTMHWEEYGNPEGEPVIFLHGGPGGSCSQDYARIFDPKRYRIILYDQRGCGKSRPHVAEDLVGSLVAVESIGLIAKSYNPVSHLF